MLRVFFGAGLFLMLWRISLQFRSVTRNAVRQLFPFIMPTFANQLCPKAVAQRYLM